MASQDAKDNVDISNPKNIKQEETDICNTDPGKHFSDYESPNWIKLNVGGQIFVTSYSTLVNKEPDSMLSRMFVHHSSDNKTRLRPSNLDSDGAYLIDRSGHYFEPILNYLRYGELVYDKNLSVIGILEEAKFYGIESLVQQLLQVLKRSETELTRTDVVKALIQTSNISELRFQGINLSGTDLRKLDFRHVNFKYAILSGCNFSMANLSYSCLERADLSHAILEGAQLLSVKGVCANLESAKMQGCNFEDPSGGRTNLEGVNLKNACLEGSNMVGINLRVANLRNANLKNCTLRNAVLAGADLESCNLSGSDLQDANLRGANLKDAQLELMVTPLHMAQAIR